MHNKFTNKDVAKFWDRNADTWTEYVRKRLDRYRETFNNPCFLKFIGNLNNRTVLDAGCGEGYNTRIFAKLGAKMTGIDISKKLINYAKQEERRNPLGIRYYNASFHDLSIFKKENFDVVVSSMALMDGPDFEKTLKEIYRVIRFKGDLFFSISHPCFFTRGVSWIRDDNGNCIKFTGSDYFSKAQWIEIWKLDKDATTKNAPKLKVPRFPMILSEYVNLVIKAGFILIKMEEPKPSLQICKKYKWLQGYRKHMTPFLYFHVKKI